MSYNFIDLTGKRFGRLEVIERVEYKIFGQVVWKCKCDCGVICEKKGMCLRHGVTRSCGCLHKEQLRERITLKLAGKRFGRLLVIDQAGVNDNAEVLWNCVCDCGKSCIAIGRNLRTRTAPSCGCWESEILSKAKYVDLVGQKFGRLTVIKDIGRTKNKNTIWLCKCDCGNDHKANTNSLRSGRVKSCNCYRIEQLRKAVTPEWGKRLRDNLQKYNEANPGWREKITNEKRRERFREMENVRFGRLTVIGSVIFKGSIAWKCKCDCGKEIITRTTSLNRGDTRSCGCYRQDKIQENADRQRLKLLGQRFGKVVVIEDCGNEDNTSRWKIRCDCGVEKIVRGSYLSDNTITHSCGCYARECYRMAAMKPINALKRAMALQQTHMRKRGEISF